MANLKMYQLAFEKAEEACLRAAQGDLEARIVGMEEVGELAGCLKAINRLLDLTDAYARESSASLEYASQRKYYRPFLLRGMRGDFRRGAAVINTARESMKRRHELTEEFQEAVSEVVGVFSTAAGELEGTAKNMSANAESTHERSIAVAAASEQAASNAQSVAAGTEELAAAIAEIERQVNDSTVATGTAVEETRRATSAVKGLIDAAEQIGRVVAFVRDIAKQTNLLALNATIEAARAGEAGRGFAVVAHEVKTLAGQVAEATADITQQVEAMQGASGQTASAIENIDKRIADVAEVATAIASAVEEQSAATAEISENVQQAAAGSQSVSGNIGGITSASQETGETARSLLESAGQLSKEADSLKLRVQDFLEKIAAA